MNLSLKDIKDNQEAKYTLHLRTKRSETKDSLTNHNGFDVKIGEFFCDKDEFPIQVVNPVDESIVIGCVAPDELEPIPTV